MQSARRGATPTKPTSPQPRSARCAHPMCHICRARVAPVTRRAACVASWATHPALYHTQRLLTWLGGTFNGERAARSQPSEHGRGLWWGLLLLLQAARGTTTQTATPATHPAGAARRESLGQRSCPAVKRCYFVGAALWRAPCLLSIFNWTRLYARLHICTICSKYYTDI